MEDLPYKILPPEITKTWEITIFFWGGGYVPWGPGNQCEIQWFFMILRICKSFSLYLLVENSFNFKLDFFTYFEYISGGIIRKNILCSDYHGGRWKWFKKNKNFLQTSHQIFSQESFVNFPLLWAFMVYNFCENSFLGGKSRKNGIPVIKITLSLQKIPQNYRFSWVNTKTIKHTCRFNTS